MTVQSIILCYLNRADRFCASQAVGWAMPTLLEELANDCHRS